MSEDSETKRLVNLAILATVGAIGMLLGYFKPNKPTVPNRPPIHPGVIMRGIVERKGLTVEEVSSDSGVPVQKLQLLFNGEIDFDEELRDRLRNKLQEAAELMYLHQETYDHYKKFGKWPAPRRAAGQIALS